MNLTCTNDVSVQEWENFLVSFHLPPFLQSCFMRRLHASLKEETWAVGVRDADNVLVGIGFGIVTRARRGSYFFLPYGPVCRPDFREAVLGALTPFLAARAREENIDFLRMSPFWEDSMPLRAMVEAQGWRRSPIHMLGEHIWHVDLSPTEEMLLRNMRKTTRNLIRRAQRDGVTVKMIHAPDAQELQEFLGLYHATARRQEFFPYPDNLLRAEWQAFSPENAMLLLASCQNVLLSAAMIIMVGDMASYHHGASLNSKIPASHLLQWRAMQEAKQRGCRNYNFWGIVPDNRMQSRFLRRTHPFAGVTIFKKGFGGERLDLLSAHDFPLRRRYWMTAGFETARRLKRGFF